MNVGKSRGLRASRRNDVVVWVLGLLVLISVFFLLNNRNPPRADGARHAQQRQSGPAVVRDTLAPQQATRPTQKAQRPTLLGTWKRSVYLPLTQSAVEGFLWQEQRLQKRLATNLESHSIWGLRSPIARKLQSGGLEGAQGTSTAYPEDRTGNHGNAEDTALSDYETLASIGDSILTNTEQECFRDSAYKEPLHHFACECLHEVPECEFFLHLKHAPISFTKCCVEHVKMKRTLVRFLDAAASPSGAPPANSSVETPFSPVSKSSAKRSNVRVFLDSGILLSAMRDSSTLVPWETDIDLGILGASPSAADAWESHPMLKGIHFVERCAVDASSGRCRDAHYVYFVSSAAESKVDTSRLEIYPFHHDESTGLLVHPTRSWLSIDRSVVTPLVPCTIWGLAIWCPRDSRKYLDHEYGGREGWMNPKTIHWGKHNVLPWK